MTDSPDTPYYEHHVFFCLNQRKPGERTCCADQGAQAAQEHAKKRCEEGPVVVIYPQGTWYTYVDNHDIDEIIDSHIVGGKIVDRLKI
jgi:(2Fe-2S) ferredoxin